MRNRWKVQGQIFSWQSEGRRISPSRFTPLLCATSGGMADLNVEWCDFVVFSGRAVAVERILFNLDYWQETLLPKLVFWQASYRKGAFVWRVFFWNVHSCWYCTVDFFFYWLLLSLQVYCMLVEKRTGHDPHNTFSHGTVQWYSNVIIISVGHGQLKVIAVLVCKIQYKEIR